MNAVDVRVVRCKEEGRKRERKGGQEGGRVRGREKEESRGGRKEEGREVEERRVGGKEERGEAPH